MPNAYQFWFIRDLIVLVVLSPLIYSIISTRAAVLIAPLCVCWLVGVWPIYIPSSESFLFFAVGGFMGARRLDPRFCSWSALQIAAGVVAFLCFLASALLVSDVLNVPLRKLGILSGLFWVLCSSGATASDSLWSRCATALSASAFFVYATHEPVLTILRKLIFRYVPLGEVTSGIVYLLLPVVVIAFTLFVYFIFRRTLPNFTRIVTGGRLIGGYVKAESEKVSLAS